MLALDIEGNEHVADEMAALFAGHSPIFAPDTLTDNEVQHLLQKLVPVREIDEYHLQELLTHTAKRLPLETLNFLLARLEYAVEQGDKTGTGEHYSPLPFDVEDKLPLDLSPMAEHPRYEEALWQLCRQSVNVRGWKDFWLPRLFHYVSLNCGPVALRVLDQWIAEAGGDPEKIKAASLLLSCAPPDFVFENVKFVTRTLRAANAVSRDCFYQVRGHFWMSLSGGAYMRSPFEPAPHHVRQRDESRRIALQLPSGSPEREFYEGLFRDAELEIAGELKRDAELADEH